MPVQHRQEFKAHISGRKRVKTRGSSSVPVSRRPRSCEPGNDTRPRAAKIPKTWALPKIKDSREPVDRLPLTDDAWGLLVDFWRRHAFWGLIQSGATVEDAGAAIFGVKRRQSSSIHSELEVAGSPELWFERKALIGMRKGLIRPGRETEQSGRADAFFFALAGGDGGERELAELFTARCKIDLADIEADRRNLGEARAAALDYFASNHWMANRLASE